MSAAWVRDILIEGHTATSKPDMEWAVYMQGSFIDQHRKDYAPITDLELIENRQFQDPCEDALHDIWNDDEDSDMGYFLVTGAEGASLTHAVALKKEDRHVYLLMPNTGLVTVEYLERLEHYFKQERHINCDEAAHEVRVYKMRYKFIIGQRIHLPVSVPAHYFCSL